MTQHYDPAGDPGKAAVAAASAALYGVDGRHTALILLSPVLNPPTPPHPHCVRGVVVPRYCWGVTFLLLQADGHGVHPLQNASDIGRFHKWATQRQGNVSNLLGFLGKPDQTR